MRMTEKIEKLTNHELNPLATAIVAHLRLNPKQVTAEGFHIDVEAGQLVTVRWEGVAWIPMAEFREIYESADWS